MKVYIAFSIHGSNCFITAYQKMGSHELEGFLKNNPEMSIGKSRRAYFDKAKETKLLWKKLFTKAGAPYKSPFWVLTRFKELEQKGWVVEKTDFVKKFYKNV